MPTRRAILATIPALTLFPIAGCLSAPGSGSGIDPLPDGGSPDGNTRPSGTGGPGVSLTAVDDQPSAPLAIDVAVTREAASEEHPPGLGVSVTNTGDEALTVGEARAVVFAYQYSADGTLILLPAGGDYPADPDCWRLTEGITVSEEYRTRTLTAGETMAAALSLYATAGDEADGCLPVGEYRFESQYALNPGESDERRFAWGFSVVLE